MKRLIALIGTVVLVFSSITQASFSEVKFTDYQYQRTNLTNEITESKAIQVNDKKMTGTYEACRAYIKTVLSDKGALYSTIKIEDGSIVGDQLYEFSNVKDIEATVVYIKAQENQFFKYIFKMNAVEAEKSVVTTGSAIALSPSSEGGAEAKASGNYEVNFDVFSLNMSLKIGSSVEVVDLKSEEIPDESIREGYFYRRVIQPQYKAEMGLNRVEITSDASHLKIKVNEAVENQYKVTVGNFKTEWSETGEFYVTNLLPNSKHLIVIEAKDQSGNVLKREFIKWTKAENPKFEAVKTSEAAIKLTVVDNNPEDTLYLIKNKNSYLDTNGIFGHPVVEMNLAQKSIHFNSDEDISGLEVIALDHEDQYLKAPVYALFSVQRISSGPALRMSVGSYVIKVNLVGNYSKDLLSAVPYQFAINGVDSKWTKNPYIYFSGLEPATSYNLLIRVKMKDGFINEFQVTGTTASLNELILYTHDAVNRVIQMNDAKGRVQFYYDEKGNLLKKITTLI